MGRAGRAADALAWARASAVRPARASPGSTWGSIWRWTRASGAVRLPGSTYEWDGPFMTSRTNALGARTVYGFDYVFTSYTDLGLPLYTSEQPVGTILAEGAMKVFEEIYVMTQGGPMAASKTLVYFIYETAFVEFEMGQAAAAGMALFVITLALSLVQLRLLRKKTA